MSGVWSNAILGAGSIEVLDVLWSKLEQNHLVAVFGWKSTRPVGSTMSSLFQGSSTMTRISGLSFLYTRVLEHSSEPFRETCWDTREVLELGGEVNIDPGKQEDPISNSSLSFWTQLLRTCSVARSLKTL